MRRHAPNRANLHATAPTLRQLDALRALAASPAATYRELGAACALPGGAPLPVSAVWALLEGLRRRGLVAEVEGTARMMVVTEDGRCALADFEALRAAAARCL